MIEPLEFSKLERGDWVETMYSTYGTVQDFGKFNGKRWIKSSRKNANGVWLDVPGEPGGWYHRSDIRQYVPAPVASRHNVGIRTTYNSR